MRAILILALLLAGCDSSESARPRKASQERLQAAEVLLGKTPVPRTYRYTDGELRVFQVPLADPAGFTERQNCFVWRDAEFRTASISCAPAPDILPSSP